MAPTTNSPGFRVIIVGGGIAGLTLANALQHARIDYVLLEARTEIAPQVGQSIGLGPNGSRILDQLSCYDDIMALTDPIEYTASHNPDGNLIRPKTDAFQLVQARANYCMCFLDRQAVLRVLASKLVSLDKVFLTKRVVEVEHRDDGVTVMCDDATSYDGDIVVGADGTYSKVRREMWRTANSMTPGEIPLKEQKSMLAEYKCLYGISSPVAGLPSHHFDVTYIKGLTPIVITGKDDRVYWFLIARMPKVYRDGNIPKFTQKQAVDFAEENLDVPVAPGARVTFRDLWIKRETCSLLALEEAYFSHWTWSRFVCLGDSVHKMTPNMGSGGNAAIESAASLANVLHELANRGPGEYSKTENIRRSLLKYQQERGVRASSTVKMSNYVTRVHAVRSMVERIAAYYLMPYAGDLLVDMASLSWIGAARLDYIEVPPRSLTGTMPFNPEQGLGKMESQFIRTLTAFPVIGLGIYHLRLLESVVPRQAIQSAIETGRLAIGASSFVLTNEFYKVFFLDSLWKRRVILFIPSMMGLDPASCWQLSTLFADVGTIYAIVLVESARRANMLTPMRLPLIFGLGSRIFGAGTVFPLYFFLHSSLVQISWFRAADSRLTDLSYTRSLLPVMVVGYYIPYLASYLGPTANIRRTAIWLFQMSPLWVSLGQWVLAKTIVASTLESDRIHSVVRDMQVIRLSVGSLALWSSISWLNNVLRAPFSLKQIFWPPGNSAMTFVSRTQRVFRNDQIFFSLSSLLWVIYLFRDLKKAGMIKTPWMKLSLMLTASTMSLGPGATVAGAWLWREYILATRRHKGALVKPENLNVPGYNGGEATPERVSN